MATKQVLLFGTAYKALAFATAFPSQVAQAVGALQTFNNTLKAISPTAQEVTTSNQFILDIVDRYNVPLQSARDGFTKLYASMAPAGFKGEEIRALFTGVSQAAATFGMSADKVDRVNYAFAQMASKGQVMSEELKGQLGDVLPGAMGIFAEAAGFKGPKAIEQFSKALEDGAYKGDAMRVLLKNVTGVLQKEFGPGAEGAARTFQGVINRMQNSTQLLYEAFAPVAVGFLNSVVTPLTSGIKTVTDGFNAFFTSTQAKTAGGSAFAKELEKLKPAFEGIRANVAALMPTLQSFASVLIEVAKVFVQIAGNPFVGYLARVYLNVFALTTVIQLLNLRALIPMIANFARSAYALIAFSIQCARAGQSAQVMGLMVRTAGITLRTFFATTGVGLVLVGIGMLIERIITMNQAMTDTKNKALGAAQAIRAMSQTEARQASQQYERQAQSLKGLNQQIEEGKMKGKAWIEVNQQQAEALKSAGITVSNVRGSLQVQPTRIGGAYQQVEGLAAEARYRVRATKFEEDQAQRATSNASIAEAQATTTKKENLEGYNSLQDQLAKNFTQDQLDRIEKEYQARVDKINAEFDLREARANSFQKEAIRFERQMSDIELKRQKALIDASNEVLKAQGSVAGGAMGRGAGLGAGISQYITGDPSSPYYKADHGGSNYHEHLAFVSRQAAEEAYDKLRSAGIQVTEFMGRDRVGRHTPGSAHYRGLAFDVPGAQVPVGQERELTARVQSILGIGGAVGAGAPRKVTGNEKRDVIADQRTQLALAQQSSAAQMAEAQAVRDAAVAWAQYTASITPVEEQKLQNSLLTKKNELVRASMPDDVIENEMKQFETQQKTGLAIGVVNKMLAEKKISAEKAQEMIAELNGNMASYNSLLAENLTLQRQQRFDESMRGLRQQLAIAGAIDPRAELRTRIQQENPGYSEAQVEEEASMKERIADLESARDRIRNIASSIGDAFGTAFKGILTGSVTAREALANMFQSIADSFADMVAKMIAEYMKMAVIKGIMSLIGGVAGGLGGGGANLGANSSAVFGINSADMNQYAPLLPMANGGIISGGFRAFASGGVVTGPTLGLVGEGRYNEAVIPLPDGKSVPVDLGGTAGGQSVNNVVVNVDASGSKVGGDSDKGNQLGRVVAAAVQQELVKQKRPGGLLA